ncbi:MAG: CobW family GTP-binding protein [Desulfovibrionaceae bacterium]|nr:CobW family GTP-binding protein [Desulfovibrionaceae bacterium]
MGATTNVLLLTGFLGSGKTTLLNRIIAAVPKSRKLLILVNEFGDVGIDGALVRQAEQRDGLEIVEISKGSIFCACIKSDFIKTLLRIAEQVRPDILVMEATGVANPADLQKDLKLPVFKERFNLVEQVCLIDCQNFVATHAIFFSIEKQIKSSTLFIVNKADLASAGQIEEIKDVIRQYHPAPVFAVTRYADAPLDSLMAKLTGTPEGRPGSGEIADQAEVGPVMEGIFADPFRQLDPPESLVSAHCTRPEATPELAAAFLAGLPPGVVRGKGFFRQGAEVFLVESVVGRVTVSKTSPPANQELIGVLVLIFVPEQKEAVEAGMAAWSGGAPFL